MSPHPESQLPPGWVNRRCLPTNASLKFLASQDLDDKSLVLKSSLINTREREGLYLSFDTFLLIHGPLHTLICSGPWLIFAPNTRISLSSSSLLSSCVIPRDSLRVQSLITFPSRPILDLLLLFCLSVSNSDFLNFILSAPSKSGICD